MSHITVETEAGPTITVEQEDGPSIAITNEVVRVVTVELGPQGPKGDPGDAAAADLHYTHTQSVPADVWVIAHGLGKQASTTIVDSTGDVVYGEVHYDNENVVTVTFSGAFSGQAYLN